MNIKRYEFEIRHIINELENMEKGNFYEVNESRGTPSAKTISKNLKSSFIDLIFKIANDKPGIIEIED